MNWSRELPDVLERRNKNASKTPIEYDVNVFVREEYNAETGESFWNEDQWYLHVYDYNNGDSIEVGSGGHPSPRVGVFPRLAVFGQNPPAQ